MSFKVGIPCLKCSIHPSQQTNSKTGKKAKTCGLGAAWNEMNDQRIGRDQTIDKNLTEKNVWMVGESDDDIVGIVQKEIDRINATRNEAGVRSLRKDCVSVLAIVEKPSIDYMHDLSYEQRKTFLEDSHKVMTELLNEWNPQWQVLAAVQHHDEFGGKSAHTHTLVLLSSTDDNGVETLRAKNEVSLGFYNFINKEYPKRMKELKYDVEKCRTYDQLTEQEKLERKRNPPQHGKDSTTYKYEKLHEKALELNKKEAEIKEMVSAPSLKEYKTLVEENKKLVEELTLKDKLIARLQEELKQFKQLAEDLSKKFSELARKIGTKLMRVLGYEASDPEALDLPSSEVLRGIKDMKNSVDEQSSHKLSVIPDNENMGKYRIVYFDDGKCVTVKRGLSTRDIADKHCKSIISASEILTETMKKTWKNSL